MKIKVYDITGNTAIRHDLAERLYLILRLELGTQWQPTTLDFTGVDHVLCLFLHVAIGQLYRDLPAMYVDRKLRIIGMSEAIAEMCDRCRESWVRARV